ncbi:hypothetical protein Leryth_017966 [Lithospermum erythrorhizon]|nr:hypothetical protein Leryth_017966 [Lithospermum erythrorhizon]
MDIGCTESKKRKNIMSSSSSPCAACKFLRRKCTQECVFAPYFPPDNPQKFANVHKVFGASNVSKLLNELDTPQREETVNSLSFEADYRLRDPVYGCVGLISGLQHKLSHIKSELGIARKELANYIGPSAFLPMIQHPGMLQHHHNNMQQILSMPTATQLMIRDPQQQQQQYLEAQQQMVVAREQQEMMRSYEHHHQQQQQIARFNNNGGYDPSGLVTATGFNQMNPSANGMQPSLALGGFENNTNYQQQQQQQQQEDGHQEHQHLAQSLQLQPQMMLNQHQPQQNHHLQQPQQLLTMSPSQQEQQHMAKSEEGLSASGP